MLEGKAKDEEYGNVQRIEWLNAILQATKIEYRKKEQNLILERKGILNTQSEEGCI